MTSAGQTRYIAARRGRPLGTSDAIIGAVARERVAVLVTWNVKGHVRQGGAIVTPEALRRNWASSDKHPHTMRAGPSGAGSHFIPMEATTGIEPVIGVLQTPALTTWPRRRKNGAEDEIRTRDPLLGKEMLYH